MDTNKEITVSDIRQTIKDWATYLLGKWVVIGLAMLIFGIVGIMYAHYQKPKYIAEISFSPENDKASGMGAYIGLASRFGLDLGGSGGIFEGENLAQLLRSNMLIQKTLLSSSTINNKKQLLVNYYLISNNMREAIDKKPGIGSITFTEDMQPGLRARDSIMKKVIEDVRNSLIVERADKKLNLTVARMESHDEFFAKSFVEQLVANGIQYYVDYRSKKSKENVAILQRQTDSAERLLTGNIVSVAVTNDLNVNPIKQLGRANVQRKQVDLQVTSQLYGELLKQLELSKISLRRETPLIQIIDQPILPLEKKKLGRLKGGILFGLLGLFLSVAFLVSKKLLSS